MPVDPRVEEAYRILLTPSGPTRTESARARELLREWLRDEELAAGGPGEVEEPDTSWEDVAPLELLNEKPRAAAHGAPQPARTLRPAR